MRKEFGRLQHVFYDEDEWKRYKSIVDEAKVRAIKTGKSDEVKDAKPVIRRLLGLEAPDWIVTPEDIQFFRGAKGSAASRVLRGDKQGSPKKAGKKKVSNGNTNDE